MTHGGLPFPWRWLQARERELEELAQVGNGSNGGRGGGGDPHKQMLVSLEACCVCTACACCPAPHLQLPQIYVERGLPYRLAREVAETLTEKDVVLAHAWDELVRCRQRASCVRLASLARRQQPAQGLPSACPPTPLRSPRPHGHAPRLPCRVDRASALDLPHILQQGAAGCILAERMLPEVAYKLGRAPKYGA